MTTARIDETAETLVIAGAGVRPSAAELIGPRARVSARILRSYRTAAARPRPPVSAKPRWSTREPPHL